MPESSALADNELEQALRASAPFVAYPDVVDLSGLVGRRLREAPPVPARRRTSLRIRRVLRPVLRPALQPALARAAVALVVIIAVIGGTLVFSPSARRAVAGWLGLRGVKIEVTPTPSALPSLTPTLGAGLDLGKRVTLTQAQAAVAFRILVPAELGPPDEVYLRTGFIQDEVILLYRARPGLPAAPFTGAGLLLAEFQARIDTEYIEKKIVFVGATDLEAVTVRGDPGYWIAGAPHYILYFDSQGRQVQDQTRLAGNVLLWQHGEVTFRIEADIGKEQALSIAGSAR
jgi:hypothetical protein